MSYSFAFLYRSIASIFVALLVSSLFLIPSTALADPFRPQATVTSAASFPTLIEHLRSELRSKDAVRRENALVDVIALASCTEMCTVSLRSTKAKRLRVDNETGTGAVVDLNALVPDLLNAYRSGPADGHRLLALSALINIGNTQALEQLVEEGTRQSEKTNRATQHSLAAFYLEKYPELTERTLRTRRLAIEDVRRAEVVRVRQAKKDKKKM